jgi:hypothetical protein
MHALIFFLVWLVTGSIGIAIFGFIAPSLISSDSWGKVLLGIALMMTYGLLAYFLVFCVVPRIYKVPTGTR